MTSAFGRLEWELNNSFALAVNDSNLEIGLSIADKFSYADVVDAFEAVCTQVVRDNKARQDLSDLVSRLKTSGRLRNEVGHASFGYVLGSDGKFIKVLARVKAKKKCRDSHIVDPFPALQRAYDAICEATEVLRRFTTEYI